MQIDKGTAMQIAFKWKFTHQFLCKGTAMQIDKLLLNDRLCVESAS